MSGMDKKDMNDISADEIIRRLNKTLGIEPDADENSKDDTSDAYAEDNADTAKIPPVESAIAKAADEEKIQALSDEDSDILLSYDLEDDTTLNNIFDVKKEDQKEFNDSLIGFSDTLDRLDDTVYQPAPMKRAPKHIEDENPRGVNSINISKEEEKKPGRIFFNDAEYDDMEFPDSDMSVQKDPEIQKQDEEEKTVIVGNIKEAEYDDAASGDETIVSSKDFNKIKNESAKIKKADRNLSFGFDQVYQNSDEVSSDGYNDAEHRIMSAMDFSKVLEDVYDNEKENSDISAIGHIGDNKSKSSQQSSHKTANEYTNPAQKKPFKDRYKQLYKSSKIRLLGACLFTLLLLGLETALSLDCKFPHFIDPVRNSRVLILVSFQLFLIVFAFFFDGFISGIKSLFSGKITSEFLSASFSFVTIAFGIYQAIAAPKSPIIMFSPCAFCITATLLNEFRDLKREIASFNIVSSNMVKYSIDQYTPSAESLENDEFYNYLPENPTMLKINKTNFVENFVSNFHKHSKTKTHFLIASSVCFLSAIIVFFALFLLKKGFDTSFTYAFILFSAIIPSSMFTVFSFPLYKTSNIAFKDNSAFIGECVSDDFSEAAVVSFDDKEVFPSYALKLLSVKVYGENRIDHVLFAATSVFKKLGGPLYDVFENASREIEKTDNVKIFSIYNDGIEATVNEEHILLGSASFMEKQNFIPMYTDDDQNAEAKNAKRIMYMASGGTIVAKLYLKYTADTEFSGVLQQLTDAGMCIAIKTFDPNIDTSLLAGEINIKKYPVRVIKCEDKSELSQVLQSSDATIISKGSSKSLLKVLTNCRKLSSVIKTGVLISFVSIIIGIMIAAFTLFAGVEGGINSLVIVLYQLLWMLVCNIVTRIYIK